MSKSLKYQVVKLAKENPSLRGHLLPLVTGKTANDDGLRLALTKLAYENPSLRSAVLPLVKTSGDDKIKVLNENGREVWVKKETLKGPDKSKYKPIKEEKKKNNSGDHAEWSAKVEKTKEIIAGVEKAVADLKEAAEEQKKKTDEAREKYESTRDEYEDMQNAEWNAYGKIENSDKAEELIKMVDDYGGGEQPPFESDWGTVREFARKFEQDDNPPKGSKEVKEALDEYLNSKFVKDQYAKIPEWQEMDAKKEEVEELEKAYSDLNSDLEERLEFIEDYNGALDKQKKKLADLESNEPKKKQQGGGKTKVKMEDGQKVYETPQTKEMKKVVKDTVAEIMESMSGTDRRIFKQISKDNLAETASQEEMLDDLDERIDYYTRVSKQKRPNLVKALKKLVGVIESKATYEDGGEKKQQGGGGKKKEKPAEETSEKSEKSEPKELTKAEMKKKYEESIKNSDMSADEKKKALERAKDPNFDVEGALAGMSDDEEEVKTSSLKYELVKLAHQKPELRKHILPLLK